MRVRLPIVSGVLLGAASLMGSPRSVHAQKPSTARQDVVLGAPTCGTCRVTLTKWGELGGDGKEEDGANFTDLKVTSAGVVIGAAMGTSALIKLDHNGKLLGQIGRPGDGPGEFRMPWQLWVGSGDTVYVEDFVTARVTVLDARDKLVRTFRVPAGTKQFLPLGSSRAIVTAMLYGSNGGDERIAALPLHLVRGDSIVRSFGVPIRSFDARTAHSPADRILVPYQGSVVAIPFTYQYAIEIWDTTGTLKGRMAREPLWFKPFEQPGKSFTDPPDPRVSGAWIEGGHFLWVVVKHAAPHWRDAVSKTMVPGEGGRLTYSLDDANKLFMSTVDVFDLRDYTLVASTDFPFEIRYALGGGIVGQMVWDGVQGGNVILHRAALIRGK